MSSAIEIATPGILPIEELERMVDTVVARPAEWEPLVERAGDERVCRILARDHRLEIWVISWGMGHDTGFHDHGGSSAAIAVARGRLVEERLRIGGLPMVRRLQPGRTAVGVPATHVHRVRHAGGQPAVSLHAYSPPLHEMGAYEVGPGGILERVTVCADTTLAARASIRSHDTTAPGAST
jgi:hypothetical protein